MRKHRWSFFLSLIVIVFFLHGLAGCPTGGARYSPPVKKQEDNFVPYKGPNPKTVEECDEFIKKQTKHIEDLEGFIVEQTKVNIIYSSENMKSRGWMKGDGQEHGDIADQSHDQIVATQKEIDNIKQDIASVKRKKNELLKKSRGCFMPDAMVQLEDSTFKRLADVAPGDMIMSYDIGYEKTVSRPVLEVYTVEGNHLYTINGEIQTTSTERFLSEDGWKETSALKVGELIHIDGKMVEIKTISYARADNTLHNMHIEDTHNFYIATKDGKKYLVHNSCGGGGGGSK